MILYIGSNEIFDKITFTHGLIIIFSSFFVNPFGFICKVLTIPLYIKKKIKFVSSLKSWLRGKREKCISGNSPHI